MNIRSTIVVSAVVSLSVLTGCSSHSEPTVSAQAPPPVAAPSDVHTAAFLATVRQQAPGLSAEPDDSLVYLANKACLSLQEGSQPGMVLAALNEVTSDNGATLLGAGMSAFCPEQLSKFGQ